VPPDTGCFAVAVGDAVAVAVGDAVALAVGDAVAVAAVVAGAVVAGAVVASFLEQPPRSIPMITIIAMVKNISFFII
jgi:hypothetical protein